MINNLYFKRYLIVAVAAVMVHGLFGYGINTWEFWGFFIAAGFTQKMREETLFEELIIANRKQKFLTEDEIRNMFLRNQNGVKSTDIASITYDEKDSTVAIVFRKDGTMMQGKYELTEFELEELDLYDTE